MAKIATNTNDINTISISLNGDSFWLCTVIQRLYLGCKLKKAKGKRQKAKGKRQDGKEVWSFIAQ
ncbi:MAG: hypothetical protein F6J98_04885 [Moorea sp. SIO4G2]|uniref:hypothetical protein n=1 Tax=Moorena bouillonii TaxID=207920 RepID=UPI0013FB520F|nr:hypothetical protein [Moorena bouillonii]NEO49451.1 hypothetical protein [Moorena sp. SIO4A3]NEO59780.1 hypothetical protein [Moorena sp. SIO4G2]